MATEVDPRRRRRWTLLAVCGATALLLLDVTVVNVALPAVEDDLGASFASLQWVIDAYALTLAATLLTAGALADRYGRRRVFLGGLAGFIAASGACAASATPLELDLARGAQGIGAAAMFATSLALLADQFRGRQRGMAFGVWGAVSGAALAIGPLAGGGLVDTAGWRWIFILNLPLGALLYAVTRVYVPESRSASAGRPDWPGMALFGGALLAFTFALIRGNEQGWGSTTIVASFCLAGFLIVAFVALELRLRSPMLDLRLFRIGAFSGTAMVAFAQSLAIYPMFLFLALYFQHVLGLSPWQTGLRLLPVTLALFAVAPLAGRLTSMVSLRILLAAGLGLIGAGLLVMRGLHPDSDWSALLPGMLIGGVGIGVISPALAAAMVGVLSEERHGLASGINNTFRQMGISFGIALLGAIFEGHVSSSQLAGGSLPTGAVPISVRAPFVAGLNEIFLVAAIGAFAAVPLALILIRPTELRA